MRVDARDGIYYDWRVYDYAVGAFLKHVVWADSDSHQLGHWELTVRPPTIRTEQRKLVIIIPPLKWVGVDPPFDVSKEERTTVIRLDGRSRFTREEIERVLEEINRSLDPDHNITVR